MQYDEKDRKLLDLMQTSFPLTLTPFAALASAMDITQEEVLSRVERLMEDGVLRRLGAVIDSKALGFSSCLLAKQRATDRSRNGKKRLDSRYMSFPERKPTSAGYSFGCRIRRSIHECTDG